MNLFNLFAKVSLDTTEYERGVGDVTKSGESLGGKLKSGLAAAGNIAAKGIGLIAGAATAAGGALIALEASTEEYRIAQGKLNTAFEAAGYSSDAAKQAYTDFYKILGDTDTATEASQLLAKLSENEQDMTTWTRAAAGVWGTFGDSLPIEGLIESANETAKVGQVTGTLADALNWAGISEDQFNQKLAECGSESERNKLIMTTLSETYNGAADAFYKNNEAIVASRDAQAQMDASLANLGQTFSNLKNNIVAEFLPSISELTTAFSGVLSGDAGASSQFSQAIEQIFTTFSAKIPDFLNFGTQIITSVVTGITNALPSMLTSVMTALTSLLPELVIIGSQIITGILDGITQSIPVLLEQIPVLIDKICETIFTEAPKLLQSGLDLITAIGDGIEEFLPQLVERLPLIIAEFLNFMTESLPKISNSGIQLVNSLIDGIINSIPALVENLPQLMTAFVNYIFTALPQSVSMGVQLLWALIKGIIKAIPELGKAVVKIIEAIIAGAKAQMNGIINIGKNIVEGVWKGIQAMGRWIKEKVTGFFSGIVSSVKNLLGIHSPSTVFAGIGENMAQGVGKGWEDKFSNIKNQINSDLSFDTSNIPYQSSAVSSINRSVLQSVFNKNQSVKIDLTAVIDGAVLARKMVNYNKKESLRRGEAFA